MYVLPSTITQSAKSLNLRNELLSLFLLVLTACQTVMEIPQESSQRATQAPHEAVVPSTTPEREVGDTEIPAEVEIEITDLWQRIEAGLELQHYYDHPAVAQQLKNYESNQRFFDLIVERATPFLFPMVEEVESRNLPLELVLVPIIESTFNPNAYSREHAVGLWQFLGPTARSFGVQQDWWYDGRRDPLTATRAALDYLESLHKQFNEDWLLALAAYNTGDGNVRRAIRRSGVSKEDASFWDLRLSGETRNHVPRILAIARIVAESELSGITLNEIPNYPLMQTVEINAQIDIAKAAELAELDYQQLRDFNPGYLQWATHPDQPQLLLLPIENAGKLTAGLQQIDTASLLSWDRYEIVGGDTLGGIARKLGTRVDILQTVNGISGSQIIAGNSLLIPRSVNGELIAAQAPRFNQVRQTVSIPATYTIRRGDNLWSIARKFDLRSRQIAAWNSLQMDQILRPGQLLDLSFALVETSTAGNQLNPVESQYYRVRSGDSMAKIAKRFAMNLDELLRLNSIGGSELIYPGQSIRVRSQTSIN